uniref:Uncharacterized protein n=1 Tax=Accipiter nisus TaxID=211598 RepID=A0A8B9RRZ6_9AVES
MGAFQTCFSPSSRPRSNPTSPQDGLWYMPLPADPAAWRNHPAQDRGRQGARGGEETHALLSQGPSGGGGRVRPAATAGSSQKPSGGRGPRQRAPRPRSSLRARPVGRGHPPPLSSPPLPPQWSRPAPADQPGIPAGSPAPPPPRSPLPPPCAPAPPWETPAASAARRLACHRAAPAASGDFQKKQPDDDSTPSTSNSQSDLFSGETNSDNSNTSLAMQAANSNQQLLTELNVTSPSKEECGPCTGTAHVSLTTPTKRSCDSACSECVGLVSSEARLKRSYITLHLVQVQTSQVMHDNL